MATIENVADMLFSGLTSVAMGSYARTPPQAERTQSHRPQRGELLAEPALNVAGSISFRFHVVCVSYNTHTLQGFSSRTVSLSPHTKRQATSTQRQQKNWGWASQCDRAPSWSLGLRSTVLGMHKQKCRSRLKPGPAVCNLIPAVTYVPTQLPVQYHRPGEA